MSTYDQQELFRKFDEVLGTMKNKQNLLYNDYQKRFDAYPKQLPTCKPSDVIQKVTQQLKALHKAETTNRIVTIQKVYKHSEYVALNKIPVKPQVHQPKYADKFETQLELNTQMINAIENAEATTGFTQEFNNSLHFSNPKSPIIVTKAHKSVSISSVEKTKQDIIIDAVEIRNQNEKPNLQQNIFLDNIISEKNVSDFNILSHNEEPITNLIQPMKNSITQSPLVFDLNTFESFESIAQPIVLEHRDINLARHVINSQIVGNELLLPYADACFASNTRQLSPVLKMDHSRLQLFRKENDDFKMKKTNEHLLYEEGSKCNSFLVDEILFSSDEESENCQHDLPDMPMTCALETSSYGQGAVLDKTMYVGFQTASNRSIKVCAESFHKAKYILSDYGEDEIVTSLSDLVRRCDRKSSELLKNSEETDVKLQDEEALLCVKNDEHFDPIWFDVSAKLSIETLDQVSDNKKNRPKKLLPISQAEKRKNVEISPISNKIIKVSDPTITNSNKMAKVLGEQLDDDITKNFEQDIPIFLTKEDNEIGQLMDVKSPKRKNILNSNSALGKIKKVFEDFDVVRYQNDVDCFKSKTNSECETNLHNNKTLQDLTNNFQTKTVASDSFVGFRTASNKHFKISDEAYTRTKTILENIDSVDCFVNDTKVGTEKMYRKTQCEDKNIGYTNTIYDDTFVNVDKVGILNTTNSCNSNNPLYKTNYKVLQKFDEKSVKGESEEKDKGLCLGLEITSNKPIKISDETMIESKKTFRNLHEHTKKNFDKNSVKKDEKMNNKQENNKFPCISFQTASNRPIKISALAISKSMQIFKDINEESGVNPNNIIELTTAESSPVSNKYNELRDARSIKFVNISKEISPRSKWLLDNDILINKSEIPSDFGLQNLLTDCSKTEFFKGFRTANNNPIQLSVQGLAKSKELFKDIDKELGYPQNINKASQYTSMKYDSPMKNNGSISYKLNSNSNTSNLPKGFQTASNKPIHVSMCALHKSKELFKDIDDEKECVQRNNIVFDTVTTGKCESSSNKAFKGITTDSNKLIKASEKSLSQCKSLLGKENTVESGLRPASKNIDRFDSGGTAQKDIHLKRFAGFKTASKRVIQISEGALEKSRQLFKDIDSNENDKIGGKFSIPINRESLHFEEKSNKHVTSSENIEIYGIDTQVINNFDSTLHTEDFCIITPSKSKRSGSPILSCPKAKRRKKFQTPYKTTQAAVLQMTPNKSFVEINRNINMLFTEKYKEIKIYNLLNLAEIEKRNLGRPECDPYITKFSYDTLLEFNFTGLRNDLTDSKMTVEDIKHLFLHAVNKKLVPKGWLDNHLRLIIWKLISYEITFSKTLKGVCSVRNILDQLKYRYNKELYNAERPVLRKILEKDDIPSKTLILCVVAIFENEQSVSSITNTTSNIELLLSDGWYTIKALIDRMLAKLVSDQKITVGCKIATNGSELINCEQGVSPWEDISLVRLKIFGNSTRRASWHARLGYYGNGAIMTPLSSVQLEGGKISRLHVYVTRVYPTLFIEKFEDGSTVTRSERLEHIHQAKFEMEQQAALEKLYEEVEKELADQDSQDSENSIPNKWFSDSLSLRNVESRLTHSQVRSLEARTNKRREMLIQEIEKRVQEKMGKYGFNVKRNVIPLLKIRIAGVEFKNGTVVVSKGLLSIWKPADALLEMIKEGTWIEVLNVFPTAVRFSEIHMSAGRSSVFLESKVKQKELTETATKSLNRKCYYIKDLVKNPTAPTDYNEVDTVGLIIEVDPQNSEFETSKQPFQNVYLADADRNMICINFWGGLNKFGCKNILDTGQVVACVNLQRRTGNTKKSVPHYRVTEFSYFTTTPKNDVARNIIKELVKQLSGLDKRKYCVECVSIKNNFGKRQNNENYSSYRFHDNNITKNKMFIDSPIPQKNIDDSFNLAGLDFESTFKQDTELSPQTLLRKKKVNERISKLKCYGEPPPLSPISIINISKNASNSFKSPLASKIESHVAITKKSPESSKTESVNIPSSPVLRLNRTFVKCVNPVKLNFSNVHERSVDDKIDYFADEFDASPPLSLE